MYFLKSILIQNSSNLKNLTQFNSFRRQKNSSWLGGAEIELALKLIWAAKLRFLSST